MPSGGGTDYFDVQNAVTLLPALRYEDPDGVETKDATVSSPSCSAAIAA